jgi:hypothetical protein
MAEHIKGRCQGRTETQYEIKWNQQEVKMEWLTMEHETGSLSFFWDSVLAVDTFKRDFFSVDCICLAFQTPDGWIEVNEQMKGWGEFLAMVESRLAGFPPFKIWWFEVMLPAFQTNHARLWTKHS